MLAPLSHVHRSEREGPESTTGPTQSAKNAIRRAPRGSSSPPSDVGTVATGLGASHRTGGHDGSIRQQRERAVGHPAISRHVCHMARIGVHRVPRFGHRAAQQTLNADRRQRDRPSCQMALFIRRGRSQ